MSVDPGTPAADATPAAPVQSSVFEVPPAYKAAVSDILAEFFVSHDVSEAVSALRELDRPSLRPEIAKRLIMLSLDRSDTDREMASRLLSALYGEVLTMLHVGQGFELLFVIQGELCTDVPSAQSVLARFLARAVTDEVLPPSFLVDPEVMELGGPVIDEARALLSARHAAARMEHIWGAAAGGGVEELKEEIRLAVGELFVTGNADDAVDAIRQLRCPAFHHEVVKRVVVESVGRGEADRTTALRFLQRMSATGLLSPQQAVRGFRRVHAAVEDLRLDVPAAPALIADIVARATTDGVLESSSDLRSTKSTSDESAAAAAAAATTGSGPSEEAAPADAGSS